MTSKQPAKRGTFQIILGFCALIFTAFFNPLLAHQGEKHAKKIEKMPKVQDDIKPTYLGEDRPILGKGMVVKDHLGKERTLETGSAKISILFLGFTHCPDVCPITLQKIKGALGKLSPEKRTKFQVYFFSIDPEHDTLESMSNYVVPLGKEFTGIIPKQADLDVILRNLAAYKRKIGSQLSHTDLLYFVKPTGKWYGFTRVPSKASSLSEVLNQLR